MENDLLEYLLNFALNHKIGFELMDKANPDWVPVSIAERRLIIINMNWHNKWEIPFQIAHEISHLLNNDQGVQYYSSVANKVKIEGNANSCAIDIFINYYRTRISDEWINPVTFMEHFGIPLNLEYLVTDKIYNAFGI